MSRVSTQHLAGTDRNHEQRKNAVSPTAVSITTTMTTTREG